MGSGSIVEPLYFAYGSNLSSRRMRERVRSARSVGRARLPERRLCFDKRGSDGSGKANLCPDPSASVWGALYALDHAAWEALDGFEPGYERVAVEVVRDDGARVAAHTYVAFERTVDPVPFDWYKALLVEGGREHGLPEEYVEALTRLPCRPDRGRIS